MDDYLVDYDEDTGRMRNIVAYAWTDGIAGDTAIFNRRCPKCGRYTSESHAKGSDAGARAWGRCARDGVVELTFVAWENDICWESEA